jgi:putative protease
MIPLARRPRPELLAPAGNAEKLAAALLYGADAVYLGGPALNLRASSTGFSHAELPGAVFLAHASGCRVYYCLNTFPYERDMDSLPPAIEAAAAAGVDALIVADPGVIRMARRITPKMPLHLSTQVNTTNAESVAFWADQGVSRVNVARELGMKDIRRLVEANPHMEFECFVHGAQCLAISGQCLLSAWLNARPANQGRCTHPCRFEYRAKAVALEEETRPGEWMWEATREEPFSAVWAPHDLCLVKYLAWFVKLRAAGLKIEGRMKSSGYVAQVVDVYASALAALGSRNISFPSYMAELLQTASRPLGSGFFLPRRRLTPLPPPRSIRSVVARIAEPLDCEEHTAWLLDVRSPWRADRPVTVILPGLQRPELASGFFRLFNHNGLESAVLNPGTRAVLRLREPLPGLTPGVFLRA